MAQPQPPPGLAVVFLGLGQVQCGVAAPSCTPRGEDPEGATPAPGSSSIREEGLGPSLQHPLVWGHVQEVQFFWGGCSGRAISAPPCPCMVLVVVRDRPELSSSKRPSWRARLGCATFCWHPCTSAGAKQLGARLRSRPGGFGNIGEGCTHFSFEHGRSDATPTCRARPGAQRSTWFWRHEEGTSRGDTSTVGTRNVWRVPPEHPKRGRGSCLSPGRSEQCRGCCGERRAAKHSSGR